MNSLEFKENIYVRKKNWDSKDSDLDKNVKYTRKKRKQTSIMEYVNKRELKCVECIRDINKLA